MYNEFYISLGNFIVIILKIMQISLEIVFFFEDRFIRTIILDWY